MNRLKLFLLGACFFASTLSAKTLMLSVGFNNGVHQLEDAWIIDRDFPATVSEQRNEHAIEYRILDAQQNILHSGFVTRPGEMIAEHVVAHEHEMHNTGVKVESSGAYILRIPYSDKFADLELLKVSVGAKENLSSEAQPAPVSNAFARFDLRSHLPN